MGFTEEFFMLAFLPVSILIFLLISCLSADFPLVSVRKQVTLTLRVFARGNFVLIRKLTLIALSLFFYGWASLESLPCFLILILLVYFLGELLMARRGEARNRKTLHIGVTVFILILVYFKYLDFILETLHLEWNRSTGMAALVPPLGLSFLTFAAISYLVDIYRGDADSGSLSDVFAFMTFFPKLLSGPIVLWKDWSSQQIDFSFSLDRAMHGIDRIIIGYAKKAILADTFGSVILKISTESTLSGIDRPTYWLRALLYFFQIYYDFSGYSDIAIGLAEIFGIRIKENFHFPYLSKSVTEFWRRWHISLGTWFREYVYIPLGGNRRGNVYGHLFVVFLLTGIWHGANWTYILWGVLNGLAVLFERRMKGTSLARRTPAALKWLLTMLFVFFSWILFMSANLQEALATFCAMFSRSTSGAVTFSFAYFCTRKLRMLLGIAAAGSVLGIFEKRVFVQRLKSKRALQIIGRCLLLCLLVVDILFVVNAVYSPFLYFQY